MKNTDAVKKVVLALPGNYLFAFSICLLILKVSGYADLPWWVVLAPLVLPYMLVLGFPLLLIAIAGAAIAFMSVLFVLACAAEVGWEWFRKYI